MTARARNGRLDQSSAVLDLFHRVDGGHPAIWHHASNSARPGDDSAVTRDEPVVYHTMFTDRR
jgi:hypothetical protein